jgi:putative Mg2+ transporter-C (MgtC) family protein
MPLTAFENAGELRAVLIPFLVRCGAAAFCGGLLGIEREFKGKAAGFRTNILICVGACIYTLAGILLVGTGEASDAGRIAAQVVTGIGFLGAGVILQSGGHVTGLTTAATIWVVAAIGVTAGAGFPIVALLATLLAVGTLVALTPIERRYLDHRDT